MLLGPQTALCELCPLASLEGFCSDPYLGKLLVLALPTLPPKYPPIVQVSLAL